MTAMTTKVACAKLIWDGKKLPGSNDFRWANLCIKMAMWCQNCGSKEHAFEKCPEVKVPCVYPHGPGSQSNPPHSLLMCPSLHSACFDCRIRGHVEADHEAGMQQSQMQLRQKFLAFAHRGYLTCVPFLYGQRELQPYHWQGGLGFSRLARNVVDLWTYGGLNARVPEEVLETVRPFLEQAQQNTDSTPETYLPLKDLKVK